MDVGSMSPLYGQHSLPTQSNPNQMGFRPYENNEGSVVAVAGEDFAVIASETRLSVGYSIYTRNQPKVFKLSDKTVIGIAGCWCDALTFIKVLQTKLKMYQHEFNKEMSTPAISQLITSLLYYKRFFPYYVHVVLTGIDQTGKGRVFNYDSVGNKGEASYECGGSSWSLMAPLLDSQIGLKNMEGVEKKTITLQRATEIIKDVFISAAERDIYTGDGIMLNIITKDGIKEEKYELRKD